MANPQKLITFTERQIEMANEIMAELGYNSFSQVVQQALIDKYQRTFPNYIKSGAKEEPVDRAQRKEQEKVAKKDIVLEGYRDIARRLGGTLVTDDTGGNEACIYYTYTGKKRYEQRVPLNQLSEDLIKTQYQPNRAAVEKLQKEGKVDYQV